MRLDGTELVFEGALEARVAAQLLRDSDHRDLISTVVPPIEPPRIGRFEFLARMDDEVRGRGDKTEFRCSDPSTALEIFRVLAQTSIPFGPNQLTASRKKFMGQKLGEFAVKYDEQSKQLVRQPQLQTVEIAGLTITGVDDEQAKFLKRRESFVAGYLAEKGWNAADITIEQLLEVRRQPGWQNPPEIA